MSTDPRIARTRARVLDAAWELLNEVGFDGVTVELVSDRAGVSRSTLYRHWRTMPELLRDAFTAQAGRRHGDAGDDTGDGLSTLAAYARAVATGLSHVWGPAATSLAASALVDPSQRAVLQVFVDGTRRDLRAIVDRAQDAGELADDADPEWLVDHLLDLLVAPLFYRYQFSRAPVEAVIADALADRAWRSVRTVARARGQVGGS